MTRFRRLAPFAVLVATLALFAAPAPAAPTCHLGARLEPTCGILWGVAPGAFTESRGGSALAAFERKTGRHQDIFHAYHRGVRQVFPTEREIALARGRVLLLNWKPESTSWARIAAGDRATDRFLDLVARNLRENFRRPFFLAVHHEGENEVVERAGSGYTARDYAAMYRHVVQRLRAHGVRNMVTVMVHMTYVPHATQPWFPRMYPGDDVVDWLGIDSYSYSDPGYGHGDFAEMLNRRSAAQPKWPGFYNWAVRRHPGKPIMLAEWGVWSGSADGHRAEFYRQVGRQIRRFPAIKAMVHFETPHNQKGRSSMVDESRASLDAYRRLGRLPVFQVRVM